MKIRPDSSLSSLAASLVVAGPLAMPLAVSAQEVPLSYKAAPDVYKLLAENDSLA